jgi:hypothetical protein
VRLSFSGEWEEDAKVRGLIVFRSGKKYEGELFDDLAHGKGIVTHVGGGVY